MRTDTPKFLLGSPEGWKTFDATPGCVILPGFSTYDTATSYCEVDSPGVWQLQPLDCDALYARLESSYPKTLRLVAIDPPSPRELSLLAATTEAACRTLQDRCDSVEVEYRLMRDHPACRWQHRRIEAPRPGDKPQKWFVGCLHPENMAFDEGQPLWFWLDWFEGRHVATELQTERGGTLERDLFVFDSRNAAEGFHGATVARLRGSNCHCQIDSHSGEAFEVATWQDGRQVSTCTAAAIGDRLESIGR